MVMSERKRVILLGGSFNPAHAGHIHISLQAMQALGAHEVWWLLSPHNPLKEKSDIADYELRYGHAVSLTDGLPIHISRFEKEHQLQYSADTICALKSTYDHEFIWLIGSDNLLNFHQWKEWKSITELLPIAVYDRAPHVEESLKSEAAQYLLAYRMSPDIARKQSLNMPAFIPLRLQMHPESGTRLRKKLGKSTFLAHNN